MKKTSSAPASDTENYAAILATVDNICEGYRRDNPPLPALPPGFSIDLPDNIRMRIRFERVDTP